MNLDRVADAQAYAPPQLDIRNWIEYEYNVTASTGPWHFLTLMPVPLQYVTGESKRKSSYK